MHASGIIRTQEMERDMSAYELAERFGVSRRTIHEWRRRGIIPPPLGGKRGPTARYGQMHVEAILAWRALRHHFVSGTQALVYCRENDITLVQYLAEREASVREFGIGVA